MYSSESRTFPGYPVHRPFLVSTSNTTGIFCFCEYTPSIYDVESRLCNDDAALEKISRRVYFNATVTWERVIR